MKKIPKGVIVLGIISLLIALSVLFLNGDAWGHYLLLNLAYLALIAGCIGVFMLKEWARKTLVYSSITICILYVLIFVWIAKKGISSGVVENPFEIIIIKALGIMIFRFIPLGLNIFYFTRPKVKEQFE